MNAHHKDVGKPIKAGPKKRPLKELKGMIKPPVRGVTLAAMERAIAAGADGRRLFRLSPEGAKHTSPGQSPGFNTNKNVSPERARQGEV